MLEELLHLPRLLQHRCSSDLCFSVVLLENRRLGIRPARFGANLRRDRDMRGVPMRAVHRCVRSWRVYLSKHDFLRGVRPDRCPYRVFGSALQQLPGRLEHATDARSNCVSWRALGCGPRRGRYWPCVETHETGRLEPRPNRLPPPSACRPPVCRSSSGQGRRWTAGPGRAGRRREPGAAPGRTRRPSGPGSSPAGSAPAAR